MDPDQHRQKRSRVASANLSNPNRNDRKDEQATSSQQPQPRLSTTMTAMRNLSVYDNHRTTRTDDHEEEDRTVPALLQAHHPTSHATFPGQPTFQQTGPPGYNPLIRHNLNHHPAPPPTLSSMNPTASTSHFQLPRGSPEITGQAAPTTVLPLHGSRPVPPFNGYAAGPSIKQTERDAEHPPLVSQSPSEPSMRPKNRSSRPQSVYLPVSEQGHINSYVWGAAGASTSDAGRLLLDARRESAISYHKFTGFTNSESSYRPKAGRTTDGKFLYPSINPANERAAGRSGAPDPRSSRVCPPNYYTSPNRVPNAALIASRKRKRGWPALPPQPHIYTRRNDPNFNIFDGILLYPELCFALAANLCVEDLISLYAISRDFHTIIDTRFATVILSQSLRKCPESSRTFPFRCYKYLCRPDPAPRIPHPHPVKQAAGEIRKVPSFRWLKMVLFREKACHEIMTIMAEDGVPLPSRCELALKRMWFLMDVPDNARRIGLIHVKKLVTDLDLYFMMCFLVKLDMRFNEPTAPTRHQGLKWMILSQRGLLPILRALKGRTLLTRYDVLKTWVETKHTPSPDERGLPMFGVPGDRIGKTRREYCGQRATHDTGKPCTFLLRPDQLIMREIIKRQIGFSKHFLRCLLWGYVDVVSLENYPARTWTRKIKGLDDEYGEDDECDGWEARGDNDKDDLLDLCVNKPISILVEQGDTPLRGSEMKRQADAFLDECMRWFEEESDKMTMDGDI